jgi:hypothetical protein
LEEGRVRVAAVVLAYCDSGVDIFEEGERGLVDDEIVTSLPLCNSIVEKFCCSSGDEVPFESQLMRVL